MQVSKFQSHYSDDTHADLVEQANNANSNIHAGFKVVFEHDEYWKIPVFHLLELVEYKVFGFRFGVWKKVQKSDDIVDKWYLKTYCGLFISAFNANYHKEYTIPEVLERRRIKEYKAMQQCTA